MATYQINVCKDGKFLFRTEEQPGSIQNDADVSALAHELAKRFPASEGYEVIGYDWPDRSGKILTITN